MHLIFVGAVITVVGAALFTLRPELWVWALALIWLFLFGLLNYDHVTDRQRILKWVKRPDNARVYTKLVDAMMGGAATDAVAHRCRPRSDAHQRA